MPLTAMQTIITIVAIALGTMFTRFTPFILFPEDKEPPKLITTLGKMLPAAMMGLLFVYCFKNTPIVSYPHGIPELIALTALFIIHQWKHNLLLSIGMSTVLYMILVQTVFA